MFEAYRVGVRLTLENQVSAGLAIMNRDLMRTHSIIEKMNLGLSHLRVANGPAQFGMNLNTQLERSISNASKLHDKLKVVGGLAANDPRIPNHPAVSPPGSGGGSGGGGVGGGLGAVAAGYGIGRGTLPLIAIGASAYAGHALFESAKGFDKEVNRFALFGLGEKVNAEAASFAQGMNVMGVTMTEKMRLFREAQGVFRESGLEGFEALEGAKLAAPMLARIQFATAALDDESRAKMKHSSLSMLRWVEMAGGLKSPTQFNRLADLGWKLTQSSGGNVDWEQLRQFQATAGVAAQGLSLDALAGLEPIIGALKGSRAGTGLRTAFNRLNGVVKLPNQIAHMLTESGIWDASKVEWNKAGGIKRFDGNPFTSSKLFQEDQPKWYETVLLPMYQKMGLGEDERARYNQLILGSTGGMLFTLVDKQLPTIHKSIEAVNKFKGVLDSVNQAGKSLSGKEEQFVAAWGDFKTSFGNAAIPAFVSILQNGTALLNNITAFTGWASKLPMFNTATQPKVIAAQYGHQENALAFVKQQLAGYDLNNEHVLRSKRVQGLLEQKTTLEKAVKTSAAMVAADPNKTEDYRRRGFDLSNAGGGRGSADPSRYIRPAETKPIQITVVSQLDGREIARSTATHFGREVSRPSLGTGTFDPTMGLPPVAMGYRK